MELILRNLFLALFLAGLCCADALEHYPRPWETETLSQNEGFSGTFLGVVTMDVIASGKYSDPAYATLQELKLKELNSECNRSPEIKYYLQAAIEHQEKDEKIKEDLSSIFNVGGYWTTQDVLSYYTYWLYCVENAFTALDLSAAEVNDLRLQIEDAKEDFRYGGVCDNDYPGPNQAYCWMSVQDVKCNYSGTFEAWPDLSWYPECAREHWATAELLEGQLENITSAYAQTVDACGRYVSAAEAAKAPAGAVMKGLDAQKLDKIYESSSEICESGAIGISGAYLELEKAKSSGDVSLSNAESAQGGKGERWLKTCIGQSGEAAAAYNKIMGNCLIEEAEYLVGEKKAAAESALEAAIAKEGLLNEYGKAELETAKGQCAAAESGALGSRYENYIKCKTNAQEALEYLGKSQQAENAKLDNLFSEIGNLLGKAEQDGLDVSAQKKIFDILVATKPANSEEELEKIGEAVERAAQMRYGGLEDERMRLLDEIERGGSAFSYLLSWFEAEECFTNEKLEYACAIGRLSEIEQSYEDIAEEIEAAKAPELLAGALLVDSSESWTAAVLDQGGDAYLYVNAINPLGVGAGNVKLSVPASLDYRKVDIVEGDAEVLLVSSSKGKAEIYLANVSAYENIWIVFKKDDVPCRTENADEKAFGDPHGGAYVEETVVFDCEHPVESLDLNRPSIEGISLDGVAVSGSGGVVQRPVNEGRHTAKASYYDPDAYEAEREVGLVSTAGEKTHVEYFIVLRPNRDMDYLVYLDQLGEDGVEDLEVFGYSGEKVSDVGIAGGNVVSFKVAGLKRDKEARVRISYYLSGIEEYVDSAITYYGGQNLTSEELSLLGQANTLLAANDYEAAYAKIKELEAKVRQDDAAYQKLLLKHDKMKEELEAKKALLSEALELARELGVSNGATAEMQARLDEINRALSLELEKGVLISPLENFDMGWENKELAKISKELAAAEKKIKDGWIASGADNQTLAALIEEIEKANSRFDGTKRFDDAVRAYSIIASGETQVESVKAGAEAKNSQDKAALTSALAAANELWARYNSEYSEASKTHWEGLFPESASGISKKIKALESRKDYSRAIEEAGKLITTMNDTLSLLAEQEGGLRETTGGLFIELRGQMEEKDASLIQNALDTADAYADKEQYVRALKSLEEALDKMQGSGAKQDGLLVIALTGLLILGIVALYMMRDRLPKDIVPGRKEKGREYKRLKREKVPQEPTEENQ